MTLLIASYAPCGSGFGKGHNKLMPGSLFPLAKYSKSYGTATPRLSAREAHISDDS